MSSPAIEPATSGQRARSSAAAIAWAEPGSVRSTSSRPASRISTGRSRSKSLRSSLLAAGLRLDEARRQRRRPGRPPGSTLISPSSATSRLIVAWVVRKPRSRRAAASSCWVRIGRCSTRSRIARWRSCFITSMARSARSGDEEHDEDEGGHDQALNDEDEVGVGSEKRSRTVIAIRPETSAAADADHERPELDRHAGIAGEQLADLGPDRAGDDRGRHEEAEPGRGLAGQAGEQAGIEMPDRLMPGTSANAWATPMPTARGNES